MYKGYSDLELVILLNTNDEAAFAELYNRHANRIYKAAKSRLDDVCEAEEVVQEIFLSFWKNRGSFVLVKSFDNYVSVAIKHQIINRLAKKERFMAVEKEMIANTSDLDYGSSSRTDLYDLQQHIRVSLISLSERCWKIFDLKYYHGYSQRFIAEKMAISEKTVEADLSKARKKLKRELLILLIVSFMQ